VSRFAGHRIEPVWQTGPNSVYAGNETFTDVLSNPSGATLGSRSVATVNLIDSDTVDGPNLIMQTEQRRRCFLLAAALSGFPGRFH
jgi:hypothetical protein